MAETEKDRLPCGTEAAYRRHLRLREEPCEPCRQAAVEANERRRAIRHLGQTAGSEVTTALGVNALEAELRRIKWVVEVQMERHGLWDSPAGESIRAAWAEGEARHG